MTTALVPRAVEIIELKLNPFIRSGCPVERVRLVVCCEAQLAMLESIPTIYGMLRVEPSMTVPQGYSYLIEDPGRRGRRFSWVTSKIKQ
jgi:hypothetical protein